jgi:transposase
LRGLRGGVWAEGVDGHHESSNLSPSGRGLAYEKKSAVASERDEEARGLWRWLAARFDARRLVFVDESGFHTSMTRLRARAPRGQRAYGKVPRNRGKNQTLIASINFEAYVEHFLAPSLEKGQVVVLDGLGAHRTQKVRELIEERGADLVVLPSYSPDLNPIEQAFSKIKNIVRKAGARTREALVEAIALAISALTLEDVSGWFAHCGYYPQDQYS